MPFDLIDEIAFYKAYHRHPVNVFIHVVCVPLILLTSLLLSSNLSVPAQFLNKFDFIPQWLYPYFNLGTLGAIGYGAFYTSLDVEFGLPTVPVLVGFTIQASKLLVKGDRAYYNKVAGAVFVVSWILQFIGHGVFEKKAPALLDNLVQALVMAPFFVIFEISSLLNYRSNILEQADLKIELEKKKKAK